MRVLRWFMWVMVWSAVWFGMRSVNAWAALWAQEPMAGMSELFEGAPGAVLDAESPEARMAWFLPPRPVGPVLRERAVLEVRGEVLAVRERTYDAEGRLVEQRVRVGGGEPEVTRIEYEADGWSGRIVNPGGLKGLLRVGFEEAEEAQFFVRNEDTWVIHDGATPGEDFTRVAMVGEPEEEAGPFVIVVPDAVRREGRSYVVFASVDAEGRLMERTMVIQANVAGGLAGLWLGRLPGVRPFVRMDVEANTVTSVERVARDGRMGQVVDVLAGVETRYVVQEVDSFGNRVRADLVRSEPDGRVVRGVVRHEYDYAPEAGVTQ